MRTGNEYREATRHPLLIQRVLQGVVIGLVIMSVHSILSADEAREAIRHSPLIERILQAVVFGVVVVLLMMHAFYRKRKRWRSIITYFAYVFFLLLLSGDGYMLAIRQGHIDLLSIALDLFMFGAFCFIVIGELMYAGLARRLTQWRGENWVKEVDYVYYLVGGVGVFVALNRLEIVYDKISSLDLMGPMVITFALVIKFIKVRAEINGWNKVKPAFTAENSDTADVRGRAGACATSSGRFVTSQ